MQVDIYRPSTRTDIYLFVQSGIDPQSLSKDVRAQFGELILFKSREIVPGQRLIGVNTDEILQNISRAGLHVQGINVTAKVSEGGAVDAR